jgi:hypothetical protein
MSVISSTVAKLTTTIVSKEVDSLQKEVAELKRLNHEMQKAVGSNPAGLGPVDAQLPAPAYPCFTGATRHGRHPLTVAAPCMGQGRQPAVPTFLAAHGAHYPGSVLHPFAVR